MKGLNGVFEKLLTEIGKHAPFLSTLIGAAISMMIVAGWLLGQIEAREARYASTYQAMVHMVIDKLISTQSQITNVISENSRVIGDNSRILDQVSKRLELMNRITH